MATKQTPTPWRVEKNDQGANFIRGDNGDGVALANCIPASSTNAAFIVRACNAHDDLLASLKEISDELGYTFPLDIKGRMRAAIAKAEGR